MVRSVVVGEGDIVHAGLVLRAEMERDDARRIGLQGEIGEVEPLLAGRDGLGAAEVAGGSREIDTRLWRAAPPFVLLEPLFGLADGGQVMVEPTSVGVAEARVHRL